jgi:hypothetical protein
VSISKFGCTESRFVPWIGPGSFGTACSERCQVQNLRTCNPNLIISNHVSRVASGIGI